MRTAWVLITLAGCAPESGGTGGVTWIDTLPSGTVVVHNAARGTWDSASGWRLVEDLRIGSAEGEPHAEFSRITALAVDARGRIYVLDGQAQEVRVFDSSGRFVRTIGHVGGGPGEFRRANGLAFDSAGRLWVVDPGQSRYSIFDTAGRFADSRPRRRTGNIGFTWIGGLAGGRLWDGWPLHSTADPTSRRTAYFEFDGISGYRDSLLLPVFREQSYEVSNTAAGTFTRMYTPVPFAPQELVAFDARGFVWRAVTDEYQMTQLSLAGDTVRVVTRQYRRQSVTDDDRARAIDRLSTPLGSGFKDLDPSRIPPLKPALIDFLVDDRGYLWVLAFPEVPGSRALRFDVFDPEGMYLGEIRTAFRTWRTLPRPVIRGDSFFYVRTDTLDVPYVIRARIEGRD